MLRFRVLAGCAVLGLLAGCSDPSSPPSDSEPPPEQRSLAQQPTAPRPPTLTPELPVVVERDRDLDRIDDVLNERLQLAASDAALAQESTELQVILTKPVEQAQLDAFVADGGKVRYVFRELSYGWTGTLPLDRLKAAAARLGEQLHFVAAPRKVVPFLDEATRTGRVRNVWAAGFAGQVAGFAGNSNITIAVIDTGVDGTHPDLATRMQGWKDYSPDAAASNRDVEGHGTHVASIALGNGAAFAGAGGALKFTQSGNLTGAPSGAFLAAPIHTPTYLSPGSALVASASAKFLGGGSGALHRLRSADGVAPPTSFGSVSGASPVALSSLDSGTNGMLYQAGLSQAASGVISNFAVSNTITGYPAVGDAFATMRGVAPSCKWFGAKVFTDTGLGNTFFIEEALDDLVARRSSDNIKIANLSLGVAGSGVDTVIRAKVNTTVDAGVLVVIAAGNDGPLNTIGDPGRASKVITVGATNDLNELTTYTSIGPTSPGADEDLKPDLLAPGGSSFRSGILAADSNTADGDAIGFADVVANDYANLQGTSMATPFVAGSLALMIDALQQSGTSWSFGSSAQPLFLKMLLSASATELNQEREQGEDNSPTLGRAAAPKDRFEGHGILNPDAAIEAMLQTFVSPLNGSVSNTAPARLEWERRAWGRKLGLVNGEKVLLNLAVPNTADFDVYLYAGIGSAKGNPILRASSATAGLGTDEVIAFASSVTETAYVFVKRVSGHGSFGLTGSAVSHCSDGVLDAGELCDPALVGTVCCTATCSFVNDGTTCDDGNKCTKADTCQSGVCSGASPVVCAAADQCHAVGLCDQATGVCSNPNKTEGASCNGLGTCQSGSCVEPITGEGGAGGEGGVPSVGGAPGGGEGGASGVGVGEQLGGEAAGGDAGAATGGSATGGSATGGVAGGGAASSGTSSGGAEAGNSGGGTTSNAGTSSLGGNANGAAAGAAEPDVAGRSAVAPTNTGTPSNSSGCGCDVPGKRERDGWSALGLLAALGVLSWARRRSTKSLR